MVASFLPGRNAKQCRERWHHQLNPSIKREPWSTDEDARLLTLQRKFGNAWSRMAPHLPGRTDNAIKNRWHSAQFRRRRRASNWRSNARDIEDFENLSPSFTPTCPRRASFTTAAIADEGEKYSSYAQNLLEDVDLVWAELANILLDEGAGAG
ncbi:hypothetical protein PR003_g12762 [Phytophthora rubi]|nr:hypothetical protein PR001_g16114 [Phytophthora rubi]KAE9335933.1 hypothetical protein PR003_g12762 [Phytophthora rubi]